MIKRIELVNFMSHEHTVIEPSDGLTVLIGSNNCGKSAVVSALQVLCSNPPSTYVLRHGTKECQIIVETASGDRIVWSRKKSGSPKYEINGKTFDRLNRKVPDQLHQILRLPAVQADKESYDVHFGEQRTPIFLLGDKEKAAAQFFASSSDAIRLVEMQTLHKTKVRKNGHELERLKQEQTTLKAEIETLAPVEQIRVQAEQVQTQYDDLQNSTARAKQLESDVRQLSNFGAREAVLEAFSKVLTIVPQPPKISPTATINSALHQLADLQRKRSCVVQSADVLDALRAPPTIANTTLLSSMIEQLESHETMALAHRQTLSVLEPIDEPPALKNVETLNHTIVQLSSATDRKSALGQQSKLLKVVVEPPELRSPRQLATTIGTLVEVLQKYEQLAQLLETTERDLRIARDQFEAWILDHPQCPTCGAEVSIDSLPCNPRLTAEEEHEQ